MPILSDAWAPGKPPPAPPEPVPQVVRALERQQVQAEADVWTPARYPLLEFVREAWPIVEQGRKYDHNWHIEAICLPYETPIITENGTKSIGFMVQSQWRGKVLSYCHETNRLQWKPVTAWMQSPPQPLVKVTFEDGTTLTLSDNHPLFIQGQGYVEAGQAKSGETCLHVQVLRQTVQETPTRGKFLLFQYVLPCPRTHTESHAYVPALRHKVQATESWSQSLLHQQMPLCACSRALYAHIHQAMSVVWQDLCATTQTITALLQSPMFWQMEGVPRKNDLPAVRWEEILERHWRMQEMLCEVATPGWRTALSPLRAFGLSNPSGVEANATDAWGLLQSCLSWSICTRAKQPRLYRWLDTSTIPGLLSPNAQKGLRARWALLLSLWRRWAHGYAPYRPGQGEQRDLESGDTLPPLSQPSEGDAGRDYQVIERTISSVTREVRVPPALYNLAVEGNNNYFANGVLVHNCSHLEAVFAGTISNLLINISPRSGKSLILSVMFQPWVWIFSPGYRFLYFSYSMSLALRDARRARELIRSPWYQRLFGNTVQIDPQFDTIQRFRTTAGGQRFSSAVGGAGTGEGADLRCGDDLHNVTEARHLSRVDIEAAKDFWFNVVPSRVENFADSREIVCGQRIAVDDVSAEIIANRSHEQLIIPMAYVEPEDGVKPVTSLGWSDPRTEADELMWPAHMTRRAWETLKRNNRLDSSAQFQQDPQSVSDKLFPKSNWRYFTAWPDPTFFSVLIQSWDMRFSDQKESGSFVSGLVWGKHGPNLYLLDRFFERASFPETQTAVRAMTARLPYGPHTTAKLIENKANGPAVMQSLRSEVAGLVAIDPIYYGSKWERANAMAFLQHAGNIYLPSKDLAPWVDDYIGNMWKFPSPPDDDTDASSQAWRRLHTFGVAQDPKQAQAREQASLERQRQQALRHQASQPLRLSRTGA